ncbi:divergent PAP2 family protein [Mycoplasmatota bacterium]|nr:divergent PAP2 family protein [Mycoplasmatota bacterium]
MINYFLEISLISLISAQSLKLFTKYFVTGEWDITVMFSTGGMPSSHTALVTTLTLSLAMISGFDSIEFAISFVFSAVVIHDSMGIRYEAGKHASILNQIALDISHVVKKKELYNQKFKELLGHKPIEVFGGFVVGLIVALIGFYFL